MTSTVRPVRYRIADAGDAIRRREVFIAGDGSLTGEYLHGPGPLFWGRAPHDVVHAIRAARQQAMPEWPKHSAEDGGPLYVVLSYGTPIGWAGPGESLTVPAVRYSVTTSRHQGIARRADS